MGSTDGHAKTGRKNAKEGRKDQRDNNVTLEKQSKCI